MHRGSQARPIGFLVPFFENVRDGLRRAVEDSSLVRHYLKIYRRSIAIGLGALVVVDVLDIVPPYLLKRAVDVVVERGSLSLLAWVAISFFAVSLAQGLCRYLWRVYMIQASVLAGRDLRGTFIRHVFRLSPSFFDRTHLGELMSLAVNDIEAIRIGLGTGLLIFADALLYLMTVPVAMIILSPKLTLLACLPIIGVPWLVMRNEKEVHRRVDEVQECFGEISAFVQESFQGIRILKGFSKEKVQQDRLKLLGDEYARLSLSLARLQATLSPILDFCMSLGMVFLLLVGGGEIIRGSEGVSGAITLGTFVAFQRYIQKMIWPMTALGMAVNYYQKCVSSSRRVKKVLRTLPDFSAVTVRATSPNPGSGAIEANSLCFAYAMKNPDGSVRASRKILRDISFKIESGERVALVGHIGAGKSALLSLVPRLYPVERGMLKIDGVDINDWDVEEIRRQVGYVSQDVFLFSDTIHENVSMDSNPPGSYLKHTRGDFIQKAAQVAGLDQEIRKLDDSYNTLLQERGSNLSGGQRQRLTLARALYRNPTILVLDDALSAVDLITEARILKSLKSRSGRKTELLAAHRVSTVQEADRILVLHQGELIQQGTHAQLIGQRGGIYWDFYEKQRAAEGY